MKTYIFLYTLDITLDGGVERVVCNLAQSLTKRGFHVAIISLFKKNTCIKYTIPDCVDTKYILPNYSYDIWRQRSSLFKYGIIARYFLAYKTTNKVYDYILSKSRGQNAIMLCNSYLQTPLYKHEHIKVIGVDHSRFPFGNLRGLRFWIHTWMVRQFDVVTTLNIEELSKWELLKRPVYVMPNYMPQSQSSQAKCIKENVVLSIGRMDTEQKGFDRLIEAYDLIAREHPDWKLKIFGSGRHQEKYKKLVTSKGLESYVEIHDFTQSPELEYQKASIYAMSSREEGFPMVLLEAGINYCPLVAYDVDFGPRTIIEDGKTGFVIQDENKIQFSKKLDMLMKDHKLKEQMSEQVHESISKRYSEDVIIRKWIDLFEQLCK